MLGAQHLLPGRRLVLVDHVPLEIHDLQDGHRRNLDPAIGNDSISTRHLQQAHFAAPQRKRKSIIIAGQAGDAQAFGHGNQTGITIDANKLQRLDRRDIVANLPSPCER